MYMKIINSSWWRGVTDMEYKMTKQTDWSLTGFENQLRGAADSSVWL